MRKTALALLSVLALASCSHPAPPAGRWEGTYESSDTMIAARLEIEPDGQVRVSAPDLLDIGPDGRDAMHEKLASDLAAAWDSVAPRPMDFDGETFPQARRHRASDGLEGERQEDVADRLSRHAPVDKHPHARSRRFQRQPVGVVRGLLQSSIPVMLRCTAKRCLEARTVAMSSFEARLRRAPQDDAEGRCNRSSLPDLDRIHAVRIEGEVAFDLRHRRIGMLISPHRIRRAGKAVIGAIAFVGAIGRVLSLRMSTDMSASLRGMYCTGG